MLENIALTKKKTLLENSEKLFALSIFTKSLLYDF